MFGSATAVATAPVAADGTYTVEGLKSGSYLVTYKDAAANPGWFGVPVSVSVGEGNVSNVGALVFKEVPADSVLLITTWTNTAYDVDSYSMVDPVDPGGTATQVYWSTPSLDGENKVALERDIDAGALTHEAYPAETTLVSALASGTELRFYVKNYSVSTGSITGLDDGSDPVMPAGVTVYAMYQESETVATHYGTWFAPLNTNEQLVGMVSMKGNLDGTLSVGSFGVNFGDTATPRSLLPAFSGVPVDYLY